MTAAIREATDADAPAFAALVAVANPQLVPTAETILHRWRTTPKARRLVLVAEEAGDVVAFADAGLDWRAARPGSGFCRMAVAPSFRRRGVGTELARRCLAHLRAIGCDSCVSLLYENEAGLAFASRHGFVLDRVALASAVDPRTVAVEPPPGLELVPAAELGPEPVYAVDVAGSVGEPVAVPMAVPSLERWRDEVWNEPTFTAEGSFAALVDGTPAAIALLLVAPELRRGFNTFTATLPEHRGRGLAVAVKTASLRWAAANGITQVSTMNDDTNAPMLAVNRRLGYRPLGRVLTLKGTP
jgi:GNAT superfamily N-acetyltransferase